LHKDSKISDYLKEVCNQIRWKKAHDVISEELENHIIDQRDAFIQMGMDESTATEKAIKEMGDPILVGSELDRTHRPKTEWSIIALTAFWLFLGLTIRIIVIDNSMSSTLTANIVCTIIAICCMIIMFFLDFTFIVKHSKGIYIGVILLIFGVYFGYSNVYGYSPHVSFLFMLLPTVYAAIIYNLRNKGYYGIILSWLYFIIPLFIGIFLTTISSIMIYAFVCYSLVTYAIIKGWFNISKIKAILFYYVPSILILPTFLINNAYRVRRLENIFNPSSTDPTGDGYIYSILKNMIRHSNFIGIGDLGGDYLRQLPCQDTDYFLTALIYKYGWISFAVIVAVIGTFLIRSINLCLKQKSVVSRLITLSILSTLIMQALLYIFSNLGIILISPLTLPLISYGGTSITVNMVLIGIMLSVFKSGDIVKDNSKSLKHNKIFQLIDGKIVIDLHMD